ncbi:site-specific integrase [Pseudomonas putida]|jgi:integrase|uniref:site-specific integrase n=1 Tax=Pseudomonas putida TaxID=303 RepID=UPI000DF9CBB0|nr:site-specific integrase [Pseudomonas putida]MBH3348905.1 site-specific integrase [Pseudomonas putida]SUD78582.1 site-specific recombinase XerD [Pseudomonas putida]
MVDQHKKLVSRLKDFQLHDFYARGEAHRRNIVGLSHVSWPHRRPCNEANLYILSLLKRPGRGGAGLSTNGESGGSIGEHAYKISHLVRYCFKNSIAFHELVDGDFYKFIKELRLEVTEKGEPKKSENTVNAVGRSCIGFLEFVGRLYGVANFVSADGIIKASEKEHVIYEGGKKKVRYYWTHGSLSLGERENKRNPIPRTDIKDLRMAIDDIGSGDFVVVRRHTMIAALVNLGGRRSEIGLLTVASVKQALSEADPMLELPTLKRGGGTRKIPVSRVFLQQVDQFIDDWRGPLVRKKYGAKDHGYVFISETDGGHYAPRNITNEIRMLRKFAGIERQVCAHMFRHAFITNLFVLLIERHKIESPDEFRALLIDGGKLKSEVLKWTGGKSVDSLDTYIDLAFEEASGFGSIVDSVVVVRSTRLFLDEAKYLLDRLSKSRDVDSFVGKFQSAMDGLLADFNNHGSRFKS